jgi:hypothetical protein
MLGLTGAVLVLLPIVLYFMYSGPPPDWNVLTRIVVTVTGCTVLVAFYAGFRRLIQLSDPTYEWIGTLALGAGLLYTVMVMVSLSMEAGTAISTAAPIDPTISGALAPGQFLMYGTLGRLTTALFLLAAGFAIARTRVLPHWLARAAYAIAAFNLLFVPSLYFGADAADFYSAVGWGATAFAASFQLYWIVAVSISLLRTSEAHETTGAGAQAGDRVDLRP